jgi:predicted lipid-binding transport protein (Tim44 family)
MKKLMLFLMAFTVFFAVTAVDSADARRGGFKAPKKSFTQQPSKPADNVRNADTPTKSPTAGAAAGTTAKRGFFSGGSLMKGLMIGGLAGLLFGGMFAGMGALGNIIGFLINVLAIYFVIVLIRSAIQHFKNRRRDADHRRPY